MRLIDEVCDAIIKKYLATGQAGSKNNTPYSTLK
jgi:hypothetical protein